MPCRDEIPEEDRCPDCDGYGEYVCDCCRRDGECVACHGTGIDTDMYDLDAYKRADDDVNKSLFADGAIVGSHSWYENGVFVGRIASGQKGIRYRDYRK